MIGGGIYAVLGVVAGITKAATWFAFVLAGVVAACAGYSYVTLNTMSDNQGGSVSFVQSFVGNSTLAGMVGWTLLFGYIGSMAMYAFAFAEFTMWFDAVPTSFASLPLRPVLSVVAVAAFVGLNLLGAQATGSAENVLVAGKVGILVVFGVLGLVYATMLEPMAVSMGTSKLASFSPVMAAAVSFVAFQGWQLLFYDQDSISDPVETIRKAVYVSIPVSVLIYILVAVVTVNLVPQAITKHPHTALVRAGQQMVSPWGVGAAAAVVISFSAILSTGSAINATLFSTAHFAEGMVSDGLLPDRITSEDHDEGVPPRTVLVIGVVTAAFTAYGSLNAITSFASLAFIVVFGSMSLLAFRQRDQEAVTGAIPAVGAVGAFGFFPLMLYHLYTKEPGTFYMVVAIAAAVIALELLYFERETIEEEVEAFESEVASAADGVFGNSDD